MNYQIPVKLFFEIAGIVYSNITSGSFGAVYYRSVNRYESSLFDYFIIRKHSGWFSK